ncbi:LysM peptidoglycan-binding domain-containing protein [Vibrio harveyi]|uniref:LysM peptidoglycan-binding domain-containing protein n=1 Tax=Vibrio harveyi TaxID=669 RepID=UPI002ADF9457|nr:LysM peptidoglycan-binding domain-containing protein [Vibrio harveyi]
MCFLTVSHNLKAKESSSVGDTPWPIDLETNIYFGDTKTFSLDATHSMGNLRLKAGAQFHISGNLPPITSDYHRNTFSVSASQQFQLARKLNLELGTGYAYRSAFVAYGIRYQLSNYITALTGYRFSLGDTDINKNQFYTGLSITLGHPKALEEPNTSMQKMETPKSEKHHLENNAEKSNTKLHQYIVKRGDWLIKISKEHNISMSNLIKNNKLKNINLIYPGDVIYYLK